MSDFRIENGVLEKYTGYEEIVTIPEGVTSIGNWAFSGCSSLMEKGGFRRSVWKNRVYE